VTAVPRGILAAAIPVAACSSPRFADVIPLAVVVRELDAAERSSPNWAGEVSRTDPFAVERGDRLAACPGAGCATAGCGRHFLCEKQLRQPRVDRLETGISPMPANAEEQGRNGRAR
jgi:hypothetical protein